MLCLLFRGTDDVKSYDMTGKLGTAMEEMIWMIYDIENYSRGDQGIRQWDMIRAGLEATFDSHQLIQDCVFFFFFFTFFFFFLWIITVDFPSSSLLPFIPPSLHPPSLSSLFHLTQSSQYFSFDRPRGAFYDTVNASIPANTHGVNPPGSCSVLLCVNTAMTMPLNPRGRSAWPFPFFSTSTWVNTTLSSRLFQPMYKGASQSYSGFCRTSLSSHVKICRPLESFASDGLTCGWTRKAGKRGYGLPRREGQDSDEKLASDGENNRSTNP